MSEFLLSLIIIAPIVAFCVFKYKKLQIIKSVTSLSRGEPSERDLIYHLTKSGIPANTIFHDLYIPNKGGYTQVDLVVPTNVGIFVFEVKDYSGWIFGNGKHESWTQILNFGKEKHKFYNPIKQNEGHIIALRNSLEQLKHVPIFSIVVFCGSCEVKSLQNIPDNCGVIYSHQVGKLINRIISTNPPAPYTDKWEIIRHSQTAVANGNNAEIVAAQRQRARAAGSVRRRLY